MEKKISNFLVIGSNGREHAIILSLLKNHTSKIYCLSDFINPAIDGLCEKYYNTNITKGNILTICNNNKIENVVIGSEVHLKNNIPSFLFRNNINCFGPTDKYANIELDKAYLRNISPSKYNPLYMVFEKYDESQIIDFITHLKMNFVIKYNGIYGGKGVKVSGEHLSCDINNIEDTLEFCREIISNNHKIIIEEKIIGQEFSYHSFCDGINMLHTIPVKDYKRLENNDKGPNTGSMGSVSCANHLLPFLTDKDIELVKEINETIYINLQRNLWERYRDTEDIDILKEILYGYRGVIYGSFIKTKKGDIKIIEYNSRFGDPESINILHLMENSLADIIYAINTQTLNSIHLEFRKEDSLCKYVVPKGYPNNPVRNKEISLEKIDTDYKKQIFHKNLIFSGIKEHNLINKLNKLLITGSRTLAYIGSNNNLETLIDESNNILSLIEGPLQYRSDIGIDIVNYLDKLDKLDKSPKYIDIDNSNSIVSDIGSIIKGTHNQTCISEIGDYSGICSIKSFGYVNPVLITSIDGVGTKSLFVSKIVDYYDLKSNKSNILSYKSLGKDIVGHSINDILVKGAIPLYFTDYIASSKLSKNIILSIVEGMSEMSTKYNLPIIGGETAEMPGVYNDNSYDIVGSITGIMEKNKIINGKLNIKGGDICIGLKSSSPHTNGYSLIRKLFEKYDYNLDLIKKSYGITDEFIKWLCEPHRCYSNEINMLIEKEVNIHGLVHITGGGFTDNIPRVVPDNKSIRYRENIVYDNENKIIDVNFRKLQEIGNLSLDDMLKIFNCGIGFVIITDLYNSKHIQEIYKINNIEYKIIGEIINN